MTMEDFLEIGAIRERSAKFDAKWREAVALAAAQMEEHDRPYAAISGGKDSGVLAYLVAEASQITGKECRLWAYVSDASFPGTEETVTAISQKTGLPLDLETCPFSAFAALSEKQRRPFGKQGVYFSAVREYAEDKDLSFVGVRASESKRRLTAAKVHGATFRSETMGHIDVCYPLLWFRLEDIAAATARFDIPLHPIYGMQSVKPGRNPNGEEYFIRLGYAVSRDLLEHGTTVFMRVNYPDIYSRVAAVYPEIRNDT